MGIALNLEHQPQTSKPMRPSCRESQYARPGPAPITAGQAQPRGADVHIDVASAQVRSAFELAAIRADGPSTIGSPIRIPGPYGTVARIVWPRNGGRRNEDADPPGRNPGAQYDIPDDPPNGTTEWRVTYQVAYRLRLRCRGFRQNSSPTASHWRTSVRPGNRPEAMMDQQHGMCLAESLIAPYPEIDEADLVERERPKEWPIGRLNRAWSDRLAPENGSRDASTAGRGHPRHDETPALTGIPWHARRNSNPQPPDP